MDHSQAPVLQALAAFHEAGMVQFTPPGHKQGRGADPRAVAVLGADVFRADLLATSGLDDRRSSNEVLERAQALMADAVGAEHTFFSTCGSSLSVKAAMLSVAAPHDKLVVGRDAHKSVVSGLILSGLEPIWVEPRWDPERHLAHPPAAEAFDAAFDEHPDAQGALVTSPTPYGTCCDLAAIADVCHRRNKPLLVDEAWGAHLPFHPELPTWAMDAGADLCVTSVHKMGSGLEQGSVFHVQGGLIDPRVLKSRADLLGTTSPSVLVYAALDGWRRQMVEHGRELYDGALALAKRVRGEIAAIGGVRALDRSDFCGPGRCADLDPLQITVDVTGLGTTGYQVADWFREHRRINLHLSDHRRVSAQLTHADSADTADRLLEALTAVGAHVTDLGTAPRVSVPDPAHLRLEQVMLPRDAFFGPTEYVPWRDAIGRVTAEMLTPYPPGIPAALPGERLNGEVLEYLRSGVDAGMVVPDAADTTVATVKVAIEK
ncbi:aminotransferase class I/II-fold pyridoxal phosphate-dependent enzyme [Streptantibioticus rubrisoli]|uniref:Ornithine decarboxylase n=1 Tax=Streptantibioticus rubrisoli TaxID=1387313 RepID=A0ABT1PBC2_9ACTN|nr:aminotransferase class I/II-fold pyridoxal phosphate-dependent enzyme [Streptantibioticus rubrisoli]MCQ4042674.1 ornithine decarboxylase [Streptantibioticus rubrisoli]